MKILKIFRSNGWHLGVLGFVCLFNFINGSTDLDYLKEQPPFLTPCHISDSNNSVCLANALENFFTQWLEGVAGLKSFDPFHVKKVQMMQDSETLSYKMDMKNIILTGLSHGMVKTASISDDYTFKYLVRFPSTTLNGNYRMKGTILLLKINFTGDMELKASDLDVHYTLPSKLIEANNERFFDVSNIQINIENIGFFNIALKNSSMENAALIKTVEDLLNQSWRDFFDIMRPIVEETLERLALDRFKKIFRYVPAKYFFTDLP